MSTPPRELDPQKQAREAARVTDAATTEAATTASVADNLRKTSPVDGAVRKEQSRVDTIKLTDAKIIPPLNVEEKSCKGLSKITSPSHSHGPDFFKPKPLTDAERRREAEIHRPKALDSNQTGSHTHPLRKTDTLQSTNREHHHIPITHDDELSRKDAEFHRKHHPSFGMPNTADAPPPKSESKTPAATKSTEIPFTTKPSETKPNETPPKSGR